MNHNAGLANYKRGFTLIELLVVISIISLLSSIVFASVASAKVKAQNSVRIQSVRQINNAIALYILDNKKAPTLTQCDKNYFGSALFVPALCTGVQTASSGNGKIAWDSLKSQLLPYIKSMPVDPCGSDCTGVGYYYVSPAALYYYCANSGTCDKNNVTDESYQIFSDLQGVTNPFGFSTNGSFFHPVNPSVIYP